MCASKYVFIDGNIFDMCISTTCIISFGTSALMEIHLHTIWPPHPLVGLLGGGGGGGVAWKIAV